MKNNTEKDYNFQLQLLFILFRKIHKNWEKSLASLVEGDRLRNS